MKTENREFTCIVCPEGCTVSAQISEGEITLCGNKCKRGENYVRQEITDPRRNIASSVLVENGERGLVPVKTSSPIPKNRIFDVMEEIKAAKVSAPVSAGQVIIKNAANTGSDIVATAKVGAK